MPVSPAEARRLYRLDLLQEVGTADGTVRLATESDHATAVQLLQAFNADVGFAGDDRLDGRTRRLIATQRLWLWEHDGEVVTMVGASQPIEGVARIAPVYTPPARRGRGFGTTCTAAVTRVLLDEGSVPILYTQLSNPTSNGIYRQIGYRAVGEQLIYRLGSADRP